MISKKGIKDLIYQHGWKKNRIQLFVSKILVLIKFCYLSMLVSCFCKTISYSTGAYFFITFDFMNNVY